MRVFRALAIGAVGYVLGARAGRERYEEIVSAFQGLWNSEPVRDGREKVREQAADTFQQAQDFAADKFNEDAVKDKVGSDDEIKIEAVEVDQNQPQK